LGINNFFKIDLQFAVVSEAESATFCFFVLYHSGVLNRNTSVKTAFVKPGIVTFTRGNKFFELSNHLGNVLVTISDKKIQHTANSTVVDYYLADVVTANDYYPFGMMMPGRKSNSDKYRFSINGQEKDKELNENITTALYWEYDSRLGRRWNIDPIVKSWESPYATFSNNPLIFKDELGNTSDPVNYTVQKGDNLTKIAQKFNTSVEILVKLNGIKDADKIKLGQVLKVGIDVKQLFSTIDALSRINGRITPDEANAIGNSTNPFRQQNTSGDDYQIRSNNVSFISQKGESLYDEFKNGSGPTNSVFLDNNPLTKSVRNDVEEVSRLRFLMYQKYDGDLKVGNSYQNFAAYGGTFLPWKDNFSSAPQFIGTFSGDVFVSNDGKSLVFVISDSKSATSLFLRMVDDHDRVYYWNSDNSQNYFANTYQKYVWTEPININWFKIEKRFRGSDGKTKPGVIRGRKKSQ
jgi:RHS repeat-associated protein